MSGENTMKDDWLEESGWTKEEWHELVTIVKTKNRTKIMSFLEKHRDYEFGTPLVFDIVGALGINVEILRDLVNDYGSFIPIDEVLKKIERA